MGGFHKAAQGQKRNERKDILFSLSLVCSGCHFPPGSRNVTSEFQRSICLSCSAHILICKRHDDLPAEWSQFLREQSMRHFCSTHSTLMQSPFCMSSAAGRSSEESSTSLLVGREKQERSARCFSTSCVSPPLSSQ